jgi:hypothetical protein
MERAGEAIHLKCYQHKVKTAQRLFLTCLFLVLGLCGSFAQKAPLVTVKSYQWNQTDGTVRYAYRVINGGEKRIVGFTIGRDYFNSNASELVVVPVGWDFDKGLAPGSTASPKSWYATLVTTEESPYFELDWRNDGAVDILARQTVTGFSVVTSRPDSKYLNGHWIVFFFDSKIESALLVPDDHPVPPTTYGTSR